MALGSHAQSKVAATGTASAAKNAPGRGRMSIVDSTMQPATLGIAAQHKFYYTAVRTHKEVNKLYLQLCSCISSTVKVSSTRQADLLFKAVEN